jgi:hypothetical protein
MRRSPTSDRFRALPTLSTRSAAAPWCRPAREVSGARSDLSLPAPATAQCLSLSERVSRGGWRGMRPTAAAPREGAASASPPRTARCPARRRSTRGRARRRGTRSCRGRTPRTQAPGSRRERAGCHEDGGRSPHVSASPCGSRASAGSDSSQVQGAGRAVTFRDVTSHTSAATCRTVEIDSFPDDSRQAYASLDLALRAGEVLLSDGVGRGGRHGDLLADRRGGPAAPARVRHHLHVDLTVVAAGGGRRLSRQRGAHPRSACGPATPRWSGSSAVRWASSSAASGPDTM